MSVIVYILNLFLTPIVALDTLGFVVSSKKGVSAQLT
jgi:hypothetical protein